MTVPSNVAVDCELIISKATKKKFPRKFIQFPFAKISIQSSDDYNLGKL
jgi:hypothetical protein